MFHHKHFAVITFVNLQLPARIDDTWIRPKSLVVLHDCRKPYCLLISRVTILMELVQSPKTPTQGACSEFL